MFGRSRSYYSVPGSIAVPSTAYGGYGGGYYPGVPTQHYYPPPMSAPVYHRSASPIVIPSSSYHPHHSSMPYGYSPMPMYGGGSPTIIMSSRSSRHRSRSSSRHRSRYFDF